MVYRENLSAPGRRHSRPTLWGDGDGISHDQLLISVLAPYCLCMPPHLIGELLLILEQPPPAINTHAVAACCFLSS